MCSDLEPGFKIKYEGYSRIIFFFKKTLSETCLLSLDPLWLVFYRQGAFDTKGFSVILNEV